jgi:hypothetical protein
VIAMLVSCKGLRTGRSAALYYTAMIIGAYRTHGHAQAAQLDDPANTVEFASTSGFFAFSAKSC